MSTAIIGCRRLGRNDWQSLGSGAGNTSDLHCNRQSVPRRSRADVGGLTPRPPALGCYDTNMKTGIIAIMAVLLSANICVGDSAPTNVVGHVIIADQTLSGRGIGTVTFDALYNYFSSGDPREPYVYQKLSAVSFRVTNFDPDDPTNAWSHLLFAFTNANTGTVFDEDQGQLKGTFELFPPSPPDLDIKQQTPTNFAVGVNSQEGQMVVVQQSTNLTVWSSVATNVLWTGRWELFLPATPPGKRFFRAYVPTE